MAGNDSRLGVGQLEIGVGGGNHALDVAAIGEIDIGIAAIGEGIAGRQHVGSLEPDISIAVGMRVGNVLEIGDAAREPDLESAGVGFRWQRTLRRRRRLGACQPLSLIHI